MPMIRKEHAKALAHDAIVLDLGDLQRQGDEIIERAKRKADEIIESARRQRERLLEGAAEYGRTEGYAQGSAEGQAEGRAEGKAQALAEHAPVLTELTDRWTEAIDKFETERILLLNQAMDSVLEFAVEFARRVTKRAVELDKQAACAQLEAAMGMLLRPSRVVIAVHPDDRGVIDEALPALLEKFDEVEHAELLIDAELTPGSCVVRSGSGSIDADIQRQIDRLVDAVLPGGEEATARSDNPLEDAA